MSRLIAKERALYSDILQLPVYGDYSPGVEMMPIFLDMIGGTPAHQRIVLDAGCGTGRGSLALAEAGFCVACCDLTDGRIPEAQHFDFTEVCLWEDLRHTGMGIPPDWVYCTDVLEHIPTALTMLVVRRLLDVAKRGVFLSVSTEPDVMGAWVGEPLHKTIQPFVWWRDALAAVGELVQARDLLNTGAFLVRAR